MLCFTLISDNQIKPTDTNQNNRDLTLYHWNWHACFKNDIFETGMHSKEQKWPFLTGIGPLICCMDERWLGQHFGRKYGQVKSYSTTNTPGRTYLIW